MSIYTLYVKTHRKTGLRYLGQTSKDPFSYCGSGIDWKKHLREHGKDFDTIILYQSSNKQDINDQGRFYSTYYNVVNAVDDYGNKIWANRILETGGGSCPTDETREKLRSSQLGRKKPPRTKDHCENLSKSTKGIQKTRSAEHQKALTDSIKTNWEKNDSRRSKTAAVGKANKGRKASSDTIEKQRLAMLKYWELKKSQTV